MFRAEKISHDHARNLRHGAAFLPFWESYFRCPVPYSTFPPCPLTGDTAVRAGQIRASSRHALFTFMPPAPPGKTLPPQILRVFRTPAASHPQARDLTE
jgi:hypothetical protein